MRKGSLHFLELPVYRLPENEYYEKRSTDIDSAVKAAHDPPIIPSSPSIAKRFARNDDKYRERLHKISGAWRYNEIIGYVRLHLIFSRIHGEYWAKLTPCKGKKRNLNIGFSTFHQQLNCRQQVQTMKFTVTFLSMLTIAGKN